VLRLRRLAVLLLTAASPAGAAEVVWLETPDDELRAFVAERAGATQRALVPLDLRAAGSAWTPADDEAYKRLEVALKEARTYETKLDGELLIMRDLAEPIAGITIVRDEADRTRLYAALAYQGFAVNRYYGSDLPEDADASAYRVDINGVVVESPWADAIALNPDREVSPYDIAEAPQRVAYSGVQKVLLGALPASVKPVDLPSGSRMVIDGRPTEVPASGNIKLTPGRHLISAQADGRILARWDVTVEPGQAVDARPDLTDEIWEAFLSDLDVGMEVPPPIAASIEALGGEVWLARPDPRKGVKILALTPQGATDRELERVATAETNGGWSLAIGVHAGWFSSGDFYTQDPGTEPPGRPLVNAVAPGLDLDVAWDAGLLRLGTGADFVYTVGEDHVALYGDAGSTRTRPHIWVGGGLRWAMLTAGYQFPYHPALGTRASLPLGGGLEVRGHFVAGLPTSRTRSDQSSYDTLPTYNAAAGLALRL